MAQGPGHKTQRLTAAWEGPQSQATLVEGAKKRSSLIFRSRRDVFTRKRGLISETSKVPWDIQLKGKAGSLLKRLRLYDQGPSIMAGRMTSIVSGCIHGEACPRHRAQP